MIADIALAHGGTFRQGDFGDVVGGAAAFGKGILDHAHLRAVAVGNDDLISVGDEVDEGRHRFFDVFFLFFGIIAESVAAQSDDDTGIRGLSHKKTASFFF